LLCVNVLLYSIPPPLDLTRPSELYTSDPFGMQCVSRYSW